MPTKVGTIARVGRTGSRFVEVYLDTGEKVELSHELFDEVWASYMPQEELYFVERRGRLFRFVQWVGTHTEAVAARDRGLLAPDEVPPPRLAEVSWNELAQRGNYALLDAVRQGNGADVGVWWGRVNGVALRAPFPDLGQRLQSFASAGSDQHLTDAARGLIEYLGELQARSRS